ncbi:alanine/ornithine racemase family PLP-dependent enzyme [Lutibacter sp.]|uniref:alanine/ornithine racemase family PLP-dependent enzyme n=1 Tax=Lutibacter sp. TaxID=1925666 RepID=UPI0025BE7F28|nr:alanine/ornithine racemase family PLP-dependent enzyme [Lutibacter sp.]MCF6181445.1 alanine/ornithine racemase family PLP-dependent enzyme [Lutibacter sp.]
MITPRIEINLRKIAHNAKTLKELYGSKGIDVIGVTKVVCGDTKIANILIKSGINILADSRIDNIKKMHNAGIQAQFLLLRSIYSQAKNIVKYADISLNSELMVIKELSKFAVKQDATHKIILMVELGDLREGIMPSNLEKIVNEVIGLKGIELAGIGTNLACFGGIKPDDKKMENLSSIAINIEDKFELKLEFVSGGNSANYNWFMSTKDVGKINNLRLGESIFLGCETLERKPIPGLFTDAFTLIAEVIESKIKPSLPNGNVYQDAFGNTPKFIDRGLIKRILLGVGLQDVLVSGLTPLLDIDILGASSDHIIVDAKQTDLKVGNTVEFNLNYGALLSAMTSPYINKKYK